MRYRFACDCHNHSSCSPDGADTVLEMRRHLSAYFKGLPDFKETRLKLVTLNDPAELYRTLDYVGERWGGTEG